MRFHVVSLPHTQTTKEYLPCAYTQKVVNFCRMMKSLGHTVFLYASEDNDAPCDELITCITKEEQKKLFPPNDWKKDFFDLKWDANLSYWRAMNMAAARGIALRAEKRDFICLIGGNCQKPIMDALPEYTTVEFGIGYEGVFSKHRVFESYAWMHNIYGMTQEKSGKSYDAVIPNYFDPADFPFGEKKEDYFLFIGRLIGRKGADVAADVCKKIGAKLILAGQGVVSKEPGKIVGQELTVTGDVEHVGVIGVEERARLMSRARAVFVPTQYIGPFEGVHAEAMLCGTPVITTDWGVFTETVRDGIDGFRTRTFGEMIWAAQQVGTLDYAEIRRHAMKRFTLDVVRHKYNDYFQQLLGLWEKGWNTEEYDPTEKRERGNFA